MKDVSKRELESSRPSMDALDAIDFCLNALFKDKQKYLSDEVVSHCTYEELIGA